MPSLSGRMCSTSSAYCEVPGSKYFVKNHSLIIASHIPLSSQHMGSVGVFIIDTVLPTATTSENLWQNVSF
jgi:hypothetical protein